MLTAVPQLRLSMICEVQVSRIQQLLIQPFTPLIKKLMLRLSHRCSTLIWTRSSSSKRTQLSEERWPRRPSQSQMPTEWLSERHLLSILTWQDLSPKSYWHQWYPSVKPKKTVKRKFLFIFRIIYLVYRVYTIYRLEDVVATKSTLYDEKFKQTRIGLLDILTVVPSL